MDSGETSPDQEYVVVFQPSGARGKIKAGTSLRAAARQVGVEIESIWAENATCGKCKVHIESGRFDRMGIQSDLDHVTPIGPDEEEYLAKRRATWRKSGIDVDKLRLSR